MLNIPMKRDLMINFSTKKLNNNIFGGILYGYSAGVSESADETDSKSVVLRGVWVQVPPPAP